MKKVIKSAVLNGTAIATALTTQFASAAINPGNGNTELRGKDESADLVVSTWINNFLNFLYLIAVLLLLWGGFKILTAGENGDNVEAGKKIIINALLGILVIFIADSVVNWLINSIVGGNVQ